MRRMTRAEKWADAGDVVISAVMITGLILTGGWGFGLVAGLILGARVERIARSTGKAD